MATQFATGASEKLESQEAGEEAARQAFLKFKDKKADLAIVFGSINHQFSKVAEGIKKVIGEVPIMGCSSAGEFTEQKITKGGLAIGLISSDTHRFFLGIGNKIKEDQVKAIQNASKDFPQQVEGYPYYSAMMLIDGLAGVGEETVLAASSVLGPMVKFSGGAAADDLQFNQTKIFYREKELTDAVSLCMIASRHPIIISVKHGHKPLSPPLRVTKARNNILYEVEGQPALEIWKKYVGEKAKEMKIDVKSMNTQQLSRLLLKYEAGLLTGDDYKIRFPTSANPDGSLNFVCSIAEGAVITIMDSKEEDQIFSAKKAAEMALKSAKGAKLAGVIVFDCACREMILQDKFPLAVEEMRKIFKNIPMLGFETYGEIAMEMGQLSGFHNTTTVIMLIPA